MEPDSRLGVAGILHADLAHHLADDDLDVLIVDVNALLTVDLLDFLNEVVVHGGRRRGYAARRAGYSAPSVQLAGPSSTMSPSLHRCRPVYGTA